KFRLANRANFLVNHFAALEQEQCRNAANPITSGNPLVAIDVHLAHFHLTGVIDRDLIDCGPHHAARTAPFRPKVHQHRNLRAENVRFKRCVRKRQRVLTCHNLSPAYRCVCAALRFTSELAAQYSSRDPESKPQSPFFNNSLMQTAACIVQSRGVPNRPTRSHGSLPPAAPRSSAENRKSGAPPGGSPEAPN